LRGGKQLRAAGGDYGFSSIAAVPRSAGKPVAGALLGRANDDARHEVGLILPARDCGRPTLSATKRFWRLWTPKRSASGSATEPIELPCGIKNRQEKNSRAQLSQHSPRDVLIPPGPPIIPPWRAQFLAELGVVGGRRANAGSTRLCARFVTAETGPRWPISITGSVIVAGCAS